MTGDANDVAVRRVAIVGGGPRATYAMERLSMRVGDIAGDGRLEVHVFEGSGEFGAGRVHSTRQTWTSLLNRTGDQVSFAADESMPEAGPLQSPLNRPTLAEWTAEYPLPSEGTLPSGRWLPRRTHGMALSELFQRYKQQIESHPRATVWLHPEDVVDLVATPGAVHEPVIVRTMRDEVVVDDVLLVTGHAVHDPERINEMVEFTSHASEHGLRYVPVPYPLLEELGEDKISAGSVVAVRGTGLTALDVIFELTAGRGGVFRDSGVTGNYDYLPSGREPRSIVPFSRSGAFPFARPEDLNETSPYVIEGEGRFLCREAIARLRSTVSGISIASKAGNAPLDFDVDVLPLVVLEMAYQYYGTLFGPQAAEWLAKRAAPGVDVFLQGPRTEESAPDFLAAQLESAVDQLTLAMEESRTASKHSTNRLVTSSLLRWSEVMAHGGIGVDYSSEVCATDQRFRFSWDQMSNPWSCLGMAGERQLTQEEIIETLEADARHAFLGVALSPHKAATNGVWRDLRSVISEAIDDGGLTAPSHRAFLDTHVRHHNRFANGPSPHAVGFLAALGRAGIVCLDRGVGVVSKSSDEPAGFSLRARNDPKDMLVDVLIEGHVRAFDPRTDRSPLYRNLLDRGLVTSWVNTNGTCTVAPGGLWVDDRHHVRGSCGPDPRMTVLGPPLEGQKSFQISAMRPSQNHKVMQEIIQWIEDLEHPSSYAGAHTHSILRKQATHVQ